MPSSLGPFEGTPYIGGNIPGVQYVDNSGLQRLNQFPADGEVYLDGNGNWTTPSGTGAGEANEAVNVGDSNGFNLYIDKSGVTFRFRKLRSPNASILITQNPDETIELRATAASVNADPSGSAAAVQSALDAHISDVNVHFQVSDIDHGSIAGLGDDDHLQYHNDSRGDVRYFPRTTFITTSAGAVDAGKPIKLDAAGKLDSSVIPPGAAETDPVFAASPAGSITGTNISNWTTAFGWGNHATAGYLKTESDPVFTASAASGISPTDIGRWDTAHGWGNHAAAGYLKTETDPVFIASPAYQITNTKITNWDTAYSWGNHADAGYVVDETDPVFSAAPAASITSLQISQWATAYGWGNHAAAGYIDDAPSDGSEYIRKNGSWAVVTAAGIPEAPVDGNVYARQNGGWVLAPGGGTGEGEANRGENVGSGSVLYAGMNGVNLQFRSIRSVDDSISVSQTATEIQVSATPASIGADPAGSAATVQSALDTHTANTSIHFADIGSTEDTQYIRINEAGVKKWKALAETDPVFSAHVSATITAQNIANWNAAHGWGDHSLAGYVTTETDPVFGASPAASISNTQITNWQTAFGWGDHAQAGYLTSESDPIFSASVASGITTTQIDNWNAAHSWGDHADAGYLTTESDPVFSASAAAGILSQQITEWDTAFSWGNHAAAGYIGDAPSDGSQYTRQDGAWAELVPPTVSPGGTNGHIQYNNAGSLDGSPNILVNDGSSTVVTTILYANGTIRLANNIPIQGTNSAGDAFPWLLKLGSDDHTYTYLAAQDKAFKVADSLGASIIWFQANSILNFRPTTIQISSGQGATVLDLVNNQDTPGYFKCRSGLLLDKGFWFSFQPYDNSSASAASWHLGRSDTNNFELRDVLNDLTPRIYIQPDARTSLNSRGGFGVNINDRANSGIGGLLVYSGGATPQVWTRIAGRAIYSNGTQYDQRISGGTVNDGGTIVLCGSTQGSYPNSIVFREGVTDICIANSNGWSFRNISASFGTAERVVNTTSIDLRLGNHLTLNVSSLGGDVGVTLIPPNGPASGTIIQQQGSTPYDIEYLVSGGTIIWLTDGEGKPDFSADNNKYRIISWRWDGSNMFLIPSLTN